jgi:hypothetical protein
MYPKTIQLNDEKLKKLLIQKAELITKGRATSEEIEKVEKEMEQVDVQTQEAEKKVDVSDLNEKQQLIVAKVDQAIKEMEEIKKEIYDRMIKQVPDELHKKYDELKKKKEELETQRNKVALKAQKFNDKIIPIARDLMKPHLKDRFDDYDSLYLENGEIYATIFNHLVDYKNNFKKK